MTAFDDSAPRIPWTVDAGKRWTRMIRRITSPDDMSEWTAYGQVRRFEDAASQVIAAFEVTHPSGNEIQFEVLEADTVDVDRTPANGQDPYWYELIILDPDNGPFGVRGPLTVRPLLSI